MGELRIRTKYNKTGWRILKTPLDDKWVYAPANRKYREACKEIRDKFDRNKDKPLKAYIERMSEVIASYLGSESASDEDRYRIIEFLAEGGLIKSRDKPELGEIPGLSKMVEEAWEKYTEESSKLWKEREEGLDRARYEHGVMKRALWREITEHIHYECHPEDEKPNS